MRHSVLKPLPILEPRPSVLSDRVMARAATVLALELSNALAAYDKLLPPALIVEDLVAAGMQAPVDGFHIAQWLFEHKAWPMSQEIARVIFKLVDSLEFQARLETMDWVTRISHRFPAKENDLVEWYDHADRVCTGRVVGLNRAYATAVIADVDFQRNPTSKQRVVLAEMIHANLTRAKHIPEQPRLTVVAHSG